MTGSGIQKIIDSMPDDMKDALIGGLDDAIEAICKFADYMRKNYVPLSVIEDIQAEIEIEEQWCRVKRESIECAEGLEMASEIIIKHVSGAKEGEENGIN